MIKLALPKAVQPKVLLARYYLTQGEPERVSLIMFDLGDRQKQTPAVLEVLALSELAQKQFSKAKLSLEQLIEQQPNSVRAHFSLAQVYAGLGNQDGTKQELEKVIELAPKQVAARLGLTRLLLLEGHKDKDTE